MKFINYIKKHKIEFLFVSLICMFAFLYIVVYMTPSKEAWYIEMFRQANVYIYEIMDLVR